MIRATDLSKHYSNTKALDSLNLSVEKGEIYALLGHNGAGKTTTIHCFLGFIKPSSGEAQIDGLNVEKNLSETRKKISYIPDDVLLYPELSAIENLSFFSSLAQMPYTTDELRNYLDKVSLPTDTHTQKVKTYSKGMRQKVAIAIALAKKASVLFLDEPTSSLDPEASNEFSHLMSMLRDEGKTILMASHDLFRSRNLADKIGIMKNGMLQHTLHAKDITSNELERLYLKTIQM